MKASRVLRLLLVTVLFGTALGLSQQSAGATGSTPPIIEITVLDRFVDIDASNDGLVAYTVAQRASGTTSFQFSSRVRKTTDGGLTWPEISAAPTGKWSGVSTSSTGAVVAIIGDQTAAFNPRLYVSTDSGTAWARKDPNDGLTYYDVAVSGNGSKIVVARLTTGVSYSTDGGTNWTQVDIDPDTTGIQALLADDVAINGDGSVIVASKSGGSVWRSANGGETWVNLDSATARLWDDISISDDGATVFGVVFDDTGYIWTTASPTMRATADLGFTNSGQSVRGSVSPDGRSFIAARYGMIPRILRSWDTSVAPSATTWTAVHAGMAVLGLTITNAGNRHIAVTEGAGIYTYNPPFPLPVVTSATDYNCNQSPAGPPSGGTKVIITGQHLYNSVVTIGGQAAPIVDTYQSNMEFSVAVPPGVAGPADIVVTAAGGSTTLTGGFTYVGPPQNWNRLGSSIVGDFAGEKLGTSVAMSADGTTLAVGSPDYNGDNGQFRRGRVRIMTWNGTVWTPKGAALIGGDDADEFGRSVALSADGNTVVIGAPYNNGGYADVYRYDAGSWNQLGVSVGGQTSGGEFGRSVAISADGNTIAIGNPYDDGGGNGRGRVRIYDLVGATWTLSASIDGTVDGGRLGDSVALSADGNTVVAGAPYAANRGHASAFRYNAGSWSQLGSTLIAQGAMDEFGMAVTISADGNAIAIGAPQNDDGGNNRGQVGIYAWDGSTWTSRGFVNGGANSGETGATVAMSSDGNTMAYSSTTSCRGGTVGSVSVREFRGGQWELRGSSIDSPFTDFGFGSVVALSGSGDVVAASNSINNGWIGAVAAWRWAPPFVYVPPSSAPSTSTPPAPVGPPSASSRDALPVGDPAALFGRTAPAGGTLPLRNGEQLNVTLDDFTANENVWIGLFSDPVTIATVKANASGVLSTAFTIPSGITGDHTLVIYGTESGNGVRIPVQLTAPTLPVTGPNTSSSPGILSVLATLILTLGLLLVIWVYKRTLSVR